MIYSHIRPVFKTLISALKASNPTAYVDLQQMERLDSFNECLFVRQSLILVLEDDTELIWMSGVREGGEVLECHSINSNIYLPHSM